MAVAPTPAPGRETVRLEDEERNIPDDILRLIAEIEGETAITSDLR
jgi:hypothetical protein